MSIQGIFLLFVTLSIAAVLIFSQAAHMSGTRSTPSLLAHSYEDGASNSTGVSTGVSSSNGLVYTAVGIAVAFVSTLGLAVVIRRGNFL